MKTTDHPDRHPPMIGAFNFRDIGGYETRDGRHVATGRVFRSATLSELTPADHAVMDRLGIRKIFDLRSSRERTVRPSKLPPNAAFDIWFRDHASSSADLVRTMAAPGASHERAREIITEYYQKVAYEQAESYRAIYLGAAAGDLPLVFHCAAGKDRTGACAALMLDALGVPRETLIEDYIFTDRFFENISKMAFSDPDSAALSGVDPDIWAAMMRADRSYIETMFETVEARHGSVENYFSEILQIDSSGIASMRKNMVV